MVVVHREWDQHFLGIAFDNFVSVRARNVHAKEKGLTDNLCKSLIYLVGRQGLEPRTS